MRSLGQVAAVAPDRTRPSPGPKAWASTCEERPRPPDTVHPRNDKELAKGPARLATALGVDRELNGTDACAAGDTPLRILTGTPVSSGQVSNGPRTGVSGEGAVHPWRYWVTDDPTVSPYRAHVPRRRRS
nr:DNA-3-methyladenine glycosylase [Streptomyces sp. 13-12-16]